MNVTAVIRKVMDTPTEPVGLVLSSVTDPWLVLFSLPARSRVRMSTGLLPSWVRYAVAV